jgi:hypothetical protein
MLVTDNFYFCTSPKLSFLIRVSNLNQMCALTMFTDAIDEVAPEGANLTEPQARLKWNNLR